MTVLWTLLIGSAYVLTALLALVAVLVVMPLDLRAAGAVGDDTLDGHVMASWGWGLIAIRAQAGAGIELYLVGLRVWRFSGEQTPEKKEKKRQKKQAKKQRKKDKKKQDAQASATSKLLWAKNYRRWLWRVGARAVSALRLRLRVRGILGLDDPADTFVLFELLGELERLPGVELDLERDYIDDTLELDVELSGRLWLLAFVAVVVSELLKLETWQALRAMP